MTTASQWASLSNGLTWTLTALAIASLFLRLWCKHRLLLRSSSSPPPADDWVLALSLVALVIASCAMSHAYGAGFTTSSVTERHMRDLSLMISLSALAAAWSKTAFAVTLWAISPARGWARKTLVVAVVLLDGISATHAFNAWIRVCGATEDSGWGVYLHDGCWELDRGTAVAYAASAYSGFLDIVFALWPWVVIMKLKLSMAEKVGTGVAMSLGIMAFVATAIRFVVLEGILVDVKGSGTYSLLAITMIAEPALSIVAQSIPVFRLLLRVGEPRTAVPDLNPVERATLDTGRRIIEQDNDSMRLELFVTPGGRVLPVSSNDQLGSAKDFDV